MKNYIIYWLKHQKNNFLKKINVDKKDCIIIDNSYRNIQRCIELGIQYEYITKENNLINVLIKLISK